jgi:cell division protein FtsQ
VIVEPARRPSVAAPDATAAHWTRVNPASKAPPVVTYRAQERLREKQRVERRRRWSVGARRSAYLAVALVAGWLALLSPVFALDPEKVEVNGAGAVVDAALVDATLSPYEGRALVTLNTEHMRHQLMDLPGVRDAVVDRVWPAGLRVTITTRVPVAAIPRPEGGYVLLDDEAVSVAVIEAVPSDVPVVTIPLNTDKERILDTVITVINELPADVRARVGAVTAATEDSVQFQLRDGPRVEWGSAEQSALKASVLTTILSSPQAQSAAVIDVSAPTLPITRAN